ncbi:MAG: shikimate dehydrogenase [Sphingomonadaceae bacterium]|nr:shikimate dehydrogenase [Sphingomonadaceae bacterium]
MYAEVIGDPIAHSKSPAIHRFWLAKLGLEAGYEATRVTDLAAYFAARCRDPGWRGCNVTAPHKLAVIPFLDEASPIGAVNCIVPADGRLTGLNTDVDGIVEAVAGADCSKVVLIGNGGAAKAARRALADAGELVNVTRQNIENAALIAGATLIVNATPLGMAHAGPMPAVLLAALPSAAPDAIVLDMVYEPLDTPLLQAARAAGLRSVDGLAMLIGQARRAFRLFFGAEPPSEHDAELRHLLSEGTSQV